ncbi:MAG: hypothetical protein RLZ35_608 [Pseudomonadota bacterium]
MADLVTFPILSHVIGSMCMALGTSALTCIGSSILVLPQRLDYFRTCINTRSALRSAPNGLPIAQHAIIDESENLVNPQRPMLFGYQSNVNNNDDWANALHQENERENDEEIALNQPEQVVRGGWSCGIL